MGSPREDASAQTGKKQDRRPIKVTQPIKFNERSLLKLYHEWTIQLFILFINEDTYTHDNKDMHFSTESCAGFECRPGLSEVLRLESGPPSWVSAPLLLRASPGKGSPVVPARTCATSSD